MNQSENPQVFHKITTGPDITQILVGLQSAIQTLTNDIKELNKQQQQLQQQQQQMEKISIAKIKSHVKRDYG